MSGKKYKKKLVVELIEDIELAQSLVNGVQTGSEDMQALTKVIKILFKIKGEVEKLDGLFISKELWDEINENYKKLTERRSELLEELDEIDSELDGDNTWLNWMVNREVIKMD